MKTFKLVILGMVLFLAGTVQAQVSAHFNVGNPPQWGPAGYSGVRYYYLPDVEAYYDVQSSKFVYFEGRSWVRRSYLPSRYKNYDLYWGYKVVMEGYHGDAPYFNHREYRYKYGKGYHGKPQKTIGERPKRGNENLRSYRSGNQVNRGRGDVIDKKDRRGDNSYNRRGDEKRNVKHGDDKKEKTDRGRINNNNKGK